MVLPFQLCSRTPHKLRCAPAWYIPHRSEPESFAPPVLKLIRNHGTRIPQIPSPETELTHPISRI